MTPRLPALLVAAATVLGFWLRTVDLAATPPEMTSDHIEKLQDALRVHEGYRTVFFGNNGGREALQMYVVALLAGPLGLGFNFGALKWATILEGVVTLPALAWMARQLIGDRTPDDRQLGAWAGAALAGLVAVSSWHIMLSRLGLRIVLTPLVAAIAIGAAARAARARGTIDALALGAVLGVGLYTYQASRLLPIAVIAPLLAARRWRAAGLAMLVAFVLAIPMYRYSRAHPNEFWQRTEGRLFGDRALLEPASNGRVSRLLASRDVFAGSYADALGMYHVRGDAAWIDNAELRPALDPVSRVLVVIGLVAWASWVSRWRDPAFWLPPVSILVMLLPSALAVAFPIENPSFTRASGTLPGIYFLAALPAGWVLHRACVAGWTLGGVRCGPLAATLGLVALIAAAYPWNRDNYFTAYRVNYERHWRPYGEIARPLRAFVESGGSFGNAFVVAYPHWLDHRILGARAGDLRWPNGLAARDELGAAIARNAGTPYAFDPAKPVLVMFHPADAETARYLTEKLAGGEFRTVSYRWPDGSGDGLGILKVFAAPAGALR